METNRALVLSFLQENGIDPKEITQGLPLVQNDPVIVRSSRWTPAFGLGLKPGDAIVRAYDPWADHYTVTGQYLYVNRDRHLAHKSYI